MNRATEDGSTNLPELWESINSTGHADINSSGTLTLIILYACVFFVGILGNTSLIFALCSQQGRLKNPLLMALCVADLLVCGCTVPITIVMITASRKSWHMSITTCKVTFYLQVLPVVASTFGLMVLSLDRYATVKHSRIFTKIRPRNYIPLVASVMVWVVAGAVSTPALIVKTSHPEDGICHDDWSSTDIRTSAMVLYLVLVYVIPAVVVIVSHLGVRARLCALSLTARAAHGELPLPMPILRRSTHVVIVAGMANNAQAKVMYQRNGNNDDDSSDNNCADKLVNKRSGRHYPRQPSYKNNSRQGKPKLSTRNDVRRKPPGQAAESLLQPQPQASTLRSRRRLANLLVSVAAVFAGCWLPHVVCSLYVELKHGSIASHRHLLEFSLLLGHAHSALNPVMYWALNYQSLRQQTCIPCGRFSSAQRFFRGHFRFPNSPPPPSSTNEAALGPFNPRYIKARPMAAVPAGSSHYLY